MWRSSHVVCRAPWPRLTAQLCACYHCYQSRSRSTAERTQLRKGVTRPSQLKDSTYTPFFKPTVGFEPTPSSVPGQETDILLTGFPVSNHYDEEDRQSSWIKFRGNAAFCEKFLNSFMRKGSQDIIRNVIYLTLPFLHIHEGSHRPNTRISIHQNKAVWTFIQVLYFKIS